MAARTDWAIMTSPTGGTSDLQLVAIADVPTFAQQHGAGDTVINYVGVAPGMFETGTATYNGTTHQFTGRTVAKSWISGAFGTDPVPFPTTGVQIFDAETSFTSVDKDSVQTLSNKTLLLPVIAAFTNAQHDHSNAAGGGALANNAVTPAMIAAAAVVKSFIGAADEAAMRAILGLGSAAIESSGAFAPISHTHTLLSLGGILGSIGLGKTIVGDVDGNPTWGFITAETIGGEEATNADIREAAGTLIRPIPYGFTAANGTVPMLEMPDIDGVVARLVQFAKAGTGTANVTVRIAGTPVTGLTTLPAPASRTVTSSTAANVAVARSLITLEITDVVGTVYISGQIEVEVSD